MVIQNKDTPDPGTFIGEGKVDEVKDLVAPPGADLVIFDNDLSPQPGPGAHRADRGFRSWTAPP